jgi:hypothetical protein
MSKIKNLSLVVLSCVLTLIGTIAIGQPPSSTHVHKDWLIDPSPYVAELKVHADKHQLELNNGLIRRSFLLQPNLASIELQHVHTQQAFMRAVQPEARVVLNGQSYNVGGLTGQPNHAFLTESWLAELKNDPTSLQFVGYHIDEPKKRFAWKRVRYSASSHWPPKGVRLELKFKMPSVDLSKTIPSSAGRELLLSDDFRNLNKEWIISKSDRDERISFQNEGKAGEIYALSNTYCFATRPVPETTCLIEAHLDAGTDRDSSWGPGLAILCKDRIIEVNLRPGDRGEHGHFELRDNGATRLATIESFKAADGGLDTSFSYRIRARIEQATLIWEVASEGNNSDEYYPLFDVPIGDQLPQYIRVGKTDRNAAGSDMTSAENENWYRSKVQSVHCYGPLNQEKLNAIFKSKLADVEVSVFYEMYDGIPCYSKWIELHNRSQHTIHLDSFTCDLLAAVEFASEVDTLSSSGSTPPNLHVETDMAFGGMMASGANRHSYRWIADPEYDTQVNYEKQTPCLLEVGPDLGPSMPIEPNKSFTSYRVWVMPHDSTDRERKGLAVRRLYRTIAPWVTENPLMMHLIASDETSVKRAIDQCADVGFEMLIMSFGSGFNVEDRRPENLAKAKLFSDYAHSKGIEIGSYSLLASRRISDEHDVVMPPNQKPIFGNSPCLGSVWGGEYFQQLDQFYRASGFTLLEHDGSYPGDVCASDKHPGHHQLHDSRWRQWDKIATFYQWCRGEGIFLNVPDHYFLMGSNKTGMGYREVNWSLPRAQQVIHTRQNIYDGTWEKLPSMGWMFVPLTQYHGGGAAATIEPLSEHLDHYERMLDSNLALGVQACYRGPRLYDSEETRQLVKSKVEWYKKYRTILEGDLIHGRRADARDIDWMLHVDPKSPQCGMLIVFNPLNHTQQRQLPISLYYTGLIDQAVITDKTGKKQEVRLQRDYSALIDIEVPAEGMAWYLIERK